MNAKINPILNPKRRFFNLQVDKEDALNKTIELGDGLAEGRLKKEDLKSVYSPIEVLKAAGQASNGSVSRPLFQTIDRWVEQGSLSLPINRMEKLLKSVGLEKTKKGSVEANYTHTFAIRSSANGGFLSSSSSNRKGRTHLASIGLYQKPGAEPNGPGAIVIDYSRGAFVGPKLKGTEHESTAEFRSIYFVEDASKIKGVEGETFGNDWACEDRMVPLLKSLERESSVSLHETVTGYGRANRKHKSRVKVGNEDFSARDSVDHFYNVTAAACHRAISDTLKIEDKPLQAQEGVSLGTRLKEGVRCAVLGACVAGIAATIGAVAGGAVVVGAAAVAGIAATAATIDGSDSYDSRIPGSYEAYQKRKRGRFFKGLARGVAVAGALAAGAIPLYGIAAVSLVAGAAGAAKGGS